ncbi:MAG: response regulator [Lachnospiraceae bacterium]|nr:response regulator [Lachnospiraceae bacterium]
MYSVLIVDDERFMREGIARLTPWEELGVDHVETAASGEEALERIREHMPQIVLTDVEMERMNGIQLISIMNQINPDLRIIVLTGHDDFAYVQECCRMNVQDYLLKPVEIEAISDIVKKQVEKLDQLSDERRRNRKKIRVEIMKERIRKETLLCRYLGGDETLLSDVRGIFLENDWREESSLRMAAIAPALSAVDEWDGRGELRELSVNSVCYEMIENQGRGIHFRDENHTLLLILFEGEQYPDARETLEQLQTILQSEYNEADGIYLGDEVFRLQELSLSYRSLLKRLKRQKNRVSVILADDRNEQIPLETRASYLIHEIEKNILQLNSVLELYEELWQLLADYSTDAEQSRKIWMHGMTDLYMAWTTEHKEDAGKKFMDLLVISRQCRWEKLHDLGKTFITELIGEAKENNDDVITNAKRYIDTHLDENLSVSNLAGQFYLSVAYFSKLFKKTAGVGCNYYIMHQRMEKAKILLRKPRIRVTEVAEQVGYQDVNYFSLTFKKYTGISPAEYSMQEGAE